jgi:hypothetical protein
MFLASGWHNRKENMESQTFVVYEITEPITNRTFVTDSYDVAVDCFNDGSMVFEKHKTITQASPYIQSGSYTTLQWHNNPNFTPNY